MTKYLIVKSDSINESKLLPNGKREGADSGDPQVSSMKLLSEANGDIGIWQCQPGGWPVDNKRDNEVTYILQGKAIITDHDSGEAVEISEGDLVILPVGWSGRWDIIEPLKKIYVIY